MRNLPRISEWQWLRANNGKVAQDLPWLRALRDGQRQMSINLVLEDAAEGKRSFVVNTNK